MESRGGEFGRYKGLTLNEIQTQLDRCVAEPSWRSFTAVLRIVREQLDSRGSLEAYRTMLIASLFLMPAMLAAYALSTGPAHSMVQNFSIPVIALSVLMVGTNVVHRRNIAESRAHKTYIRSIARKALVQLVAVEDLVMKPLDLEQRQTLRDLLKDASAEEQTALAHLATV